MFMFGLLRLSQTASALNSPGSASLRNLEPTANLNSNSSTSLHSSLKNKITRKMSTLVYVSVLDAFLFALGLNFVYSSDLFDFGF